MTAKPRTGAARTGTARKRSKRHVETAEFAAFVRRIVRAYGRRVADGDVEALKALADLTAEVDAVTRLAVTDLRKSPYSYSWDEIAARLGTTRQAAQQRYGIKSASKYALDQRLRDAGMGVTVATLAEVYADHYPGDPAASRCPGCGFRYPDDGKPECPSYATVRPLLRLRRNEDPQAVKRLSAVQFADLIGTTRPRARGTVRQAASHPPGPDRSAPSLFDPYGKDLAS